MNLPDNAASHGSPGPCRGPRGASTRRRRLSWNNAGFCGGVGRPQHFRPRQTRNMARVSSDPLAVIAAPAPRVDAGVAVEIAREYYGLTVTARELISERDRNFHLASDDGRAFVLKIANAAEDPAVTDFQVRALLHIAARDRGIAVPEVVAALDGRHAFTLDTADGPHIARLVTFLDGIVMRSRPVSLGLSENFGRYAARLGQALAGFTHPQATHSLLWDMRQAGRVRDLVDTIDDDGLRHRVTACLDGFLEKILPRFPELRSQVVHNDMNPDNVLLHPQDATRVAGVIDFGDMVSAPLVVDIAVAASYLRKLDGDPLTYVAAFIGAYHAETPLTDDEITLVFDLIRVRLAMTAAILHWRLAERGADDPYLGGSTPSESTAGRFLAVLDEVAEKRGRRGLLQPLL